MRRLFWVAVWAVVVPGLVPPAVVLADDDAGIQFFEQKIRPVLVQHCQSCHSVQARESKKLQGGLFLDSAAGIAAGGDSGATLVKGKSAESLLMEALRFEGLEMPPAGKLPDDVIADFAKWIDMGAPDPRAGEAPSKVKREINIEEGKNWWSFRPLAAVTPPDAAKPIDSFVRQAQEKAGVTPAKPTSKEKLIRRAYFDLVGLPPTPEQVAAFVADESPNAFDKVVDELLASPAYGERWGRHWLDTARFAESGGYEFDGFRPGAYHYRDWVIKSLNADMPFDEFVRLQLAGDVLHPENLDAAAATGFLVAGPYPGQITAKTVERIRYDQIDDMLMTVGGSMLGLTLGCVRCHEHKYDPFPHQDYYALAASLAKTVHGPRTMDVDPDATDRALAKHEADHASFVAALDAFAKNDLPVRYTAWRDNELPKQPDASRWQTLEPVSWHAERSYLKSLPGGLLVHDGMLVPGMSVRQRGQRRIVANEETYRLTFHSHQQNLQALRLDAFADKSLPARGPGLNGDGSFQLGEITVTAKPLDPAATDAPVTIKLKAVSAAFEDDKQPIAQAVDGNAGTAWVVRTTAKKDNGAIFEFEAPAPVFASGTEFVVELKFRDLGLGRFRLSASTEANPASWAGDVTPQHTHELRAIATRHGKEFPESVRTSTARWFAKFDADTAKVLEAERAHAAAVPRPHLTEVYTTVAGGQDVFFLKRGEVDNKDGKAEPGYLKVLWRGEAPAPTPTVDPRVSLATWMTDFDRGAGPLLARVIANRLWQHHFGQGIVGTPNDFGAQGDKPTHPELLEYLSNELVRGGWKLKPLHRAMMLSDTYRQSHEVDAANLKLDPTNKWLWHHRPQRLEAEVIRDALLAIGGNLDPQMYGPSVLDNTTRRSVYLRVKRSELLPVMTMFDAPEPTQSIGTRSVTTVPTQALALMNSPFVRQQAEKLAARIKTTDGATSGLVDRGYRTAFGRAPTADEAAALAAFLDSPPTPADGSPPPSRDAMIVEFCQVLLCLSEFVYVD